MFRSIQPHSNPLRFTCRFTQTCPDSLGLVECHLDFLKSQEGKGKSPRDKREKGRSATTHPSSVFTRHSDRAYARTNETKRFPGWFAPPNLRSFWKDLIKTMCGAYDVGRFLLKPLVAQNLIPIPLQIHFGNPCASPL